MTQREAYIRRNKVTSSFCMWILSIYTSKQIIFIVVQLQTLNNYPLTRYAILGKTKTYLCTNKNIHNCSSTYIHNFGINGEDDECWMMMNRPTQKQILKLAMCKSILTATRKVINYCNTYNILKILSLNHKNSKLL